MTVPTGARRVRIRAAHLCAITASLALIAAGAVATSAQAASSPGGTIGRTEIISRAQNWVNRAVPYSQSSFATDIEGLHSYRQDCSGFVSMAWHLTDSRNTATLLGVSTQISWDALQPGDALDKTGGNYPWSAEHVRLFVSWADAAHTQLNIMEETAGVGRAWATSIARSTLINDGYRPFRYNKVEGTTTSAPQNCPAGYVCVYPGTDYTAVPTKYYDYGTYNLTNQYGSKYIYNNQTGGAVVRTYTGYNATGTATLIPAGTYRIMDFTPINSIRLSTS